MQIPGSLASFLFNARRARHRVAEVLRNHAQRNVLLAGIFVAVGMVGIFAATLWHEREDALAHAEQQAGNLALIAQRDIARNMELYSLSLQAIVDGFGRPDLMALPEDLRRAALFDRSITARNVSSAAIVDQTGKLALSLNNMGFVGQDLSEREYFKSHQRDPDDTVHISAPFLSRLDGTTTNVALSRRLVLPDGSFGGVAVLYLNVNYFRDLLQGLEIGASGRTTVFGPHGTVLMSLPFAEGLVGIDRSRSPIYRAVARGGRGAFITNSVVDQEERLIVYRTVPDADIKVLVALATSDIYAPWRERSLPIGAAVLAFGASLIALSGLLGRELEARLRAENQLVVLANTDGLTGLANRRALERILADEASRARRETNGLGVLFADVDHFKRYNDTQGHPAGDAVLAAVAHALNQSILRPGDHAGRYGGEEFMAVLAQTSAEGARTVAEKVREAVEALAIPHPASPLGVVTVSIGVAAMSQGGFTDVQAVVKAADVALYCAKAGGRNRVHLFSPADVAAESAPTVAPA
ncbi:MAG: diguanylate cyclase [Pseudomonadota bacterium]